MRYRFSLAAMGARADSVVSQAFLVCEVGLVPPLVLTPADEFVTRKRQYYPAGSSLPSRDCKRFCANSLVPQATWSATTTNTSARTSYLPSPPWYLSPPSTASRPRSPPKAAAQHSSTSPPPSSHAQHEPSPRTFLVGRLARPRLSERERCASRRRCDGLAGRMGSRGRGVERRGGRES